MSELDTDEKMGLKRWLRTCAQNTLLAYDTDAESKELIRLMKTELDTRKKYVFMILRNLDMYKCYWFSKDRLAEIKPWLNQIKEVGWKPDPFMIVLCSDRKRSRSRSLHEFVKRQKS
jgi:hypothetical protein